MKCRMRLVPGTSSAVACAAVMCPLRQRPRVFKALAKLPDHQLRLRPSSCASRLACAAILPAAAAAILCFLRSLRPKACANGPTSGLRCCTMTASVGWGLNAPLGLESFILPMLIYILEPKSILSAQYSQSSSSRYNCVVCLKHTRTLLQHVTCFFFFYALVSLPKSGQKTCGWKLATCSWKLRLVQECYKTRHAV